MSRKTIVLFLWLIIGAAAAGQRGVLQQRDHDLQRGRHHRGDDRHRPAQLPGRRSDDQLQLAVAVLLSLLSLVGRVCRRTGGGNAAVGYDGA
jgi:hypothetical protein